MQANTHREKGGQNFYSLFFIKVNLHKFSATNFKNSHDRHETGRLFIVESKIQESEFHVRFIMHYDHFFMFLKSGEGSRLMIL